MRKRYRHLSNLGSSGSVCCNDEINYPLLIIPSLGGLWGLYSQCRLDICTRTAGISWNESCPGIQWTAKTEGWLRGTASWEGGEGLRGQTWEKGSISIHSEEGHRGVVWEQECGYVRKPEKSQCRDGTQLGEILRKSRRSFCSEQEKIIIGDVCSKAILCLFRRKWQREMQRSKFRACIKKPHAISSL